MGKITIVKKVAFVAMLFAMFNHLKAQCTFTGLNPQYCVNSATSALITSTTGGTFSGPGVINSVFDPAIAGPGTHTINYGICAASYAVASGVFAPTSTVGTALNLGDDAVSSALQIGFQFQFFCNTYNTFYISSNGFISFTAGGPNACCQGQVMPINATPDNMIAYSWVDLNQTYGGSVTYTTIGTAPNRKLVVSITNMMHHNVGEGGYPVTVQTMLYESTNVIEIHATSIPIPTNSSGTTYSTTMGIQNVGSTVAFTVPGRNGSSTWAATNDMYKFTPATACASSQTTVVSPTLIPVSGSNTICTGGSATLTASSNTTYTWSTNSNAPTVTLSPASNTSYTVSGTNSFGCVSTRILTVTVNSTPTIAVTSNTLSTCAGNTVNLTATGLNTYTWTGGISNGVTFTVPAITTAYSVTGTNACGNVSTAVTVTVVSLPVTAASTSTNICAGTAATLTTSGATTYTWLPGNNTQTAYVVAPTASVVYTVTGSSGVCRGVATISITAKPNPTITITTNTATVCDGNTATLTASGALSYTWNPGFIIAPSIVVNPTVATLYTATGPNAVSCLASGSQVILVSPKPSIHVTASAGVICPGGQSSLVVSGANAYMWDNNSSTATLVVNPMTTTTYSVIGASAAGCPNSTVITVTVFDPTLTISSSTAICRGASVNLSAAGTDVYLWSTGSGFSSIPVTPTVTNTYSVLGSSTQGAITCSVNAAVTITVNPNPTLLVAATPSTICKTESAVLNVSGATSYTWAIATPATTENLTVTPTSDQTYTVTGEDENGCRSTRSVFLRVSACVGISANTLNTAKLVVYPNPSNGDFTISSNQIIDLKITNELGQYIRTVSLNNNNKEVKISDLSGGIYFITGSNENGDVKQKIVITK